MNLTQERTRLLRESREWREQAELLLAASRLVELLGRYGRVVFTGSYRLNLMLSGDIDIKVVNPRITKDTAERILSRLIGQNFFNGYVFYDWTIRNPPEGFPRGYFVGLKRNYTRFKGRRWTVDIWLVRREYDREVRLMRFVERHLDSENRITILRFKRLSETRGLDIPGPVVYRAVLQKGISSTREFLGYARREG